MQTRGTNITTTPQSLQDLLTASGYSAGDISSMSALRVYNRSNQELYFSEGMAPVGLEDSVPIHRNQYETFAPPFNEVFMCSYIRDGRIVFMRVG